jgi:formylglycine-generating enzyme required for sulfatase activity
MADIFLSYSLVEEQRLLPLVEALESMGWSVWWAAKIPVGTQNFRASIQEQLDQASCILVALSGLSVASNEVLLEAAVGLERNILIPVLIEDIKTPYWFKHTQHLDLTGWQGDISSPQLKRLCYGISQIAGLRRQAVHGSSSPESEYVEIPPGEFIMGATENDNQASRAETPPHLVVISKKFWMKKTLVTVAEYGEFAAATHRQMPIGTRSNIGWQIDCHPIVAVTWYEAHAYCKWVGGRLPTEAEWEYSARAGVKGKIFPWRNFINPENANYDRPAEGPSPATKYPPNPWGLHDMAGNVFQWMQDWFDEYYYSDPSGQEKIDPAGPLGPDENKLRRINMKTLRGGSFLSVSRDLRISNRNQSIPESEYCAFGFRCVRPELR